MESVEVDYDSPLELSIHICVEMPFDIKTLDSPTHDVRIKVLSRSSCEYRFVSVVPSSMPVNTSDFQNEFLLLTDENE